MKELKEYIRSIPDFPEKGIIFRDVTSVLQDADALKLSIDELAKRLEGVDFDVIAGAESRGFIFGAPLAYVMHKPFVPIRKKGKLPCETVEKTYDLEYGTATIEMHKDAVKKGEKVVLLDDLIATGGTMKAAAELVEELGGEVVKMLFLIELSDLNGREVLKDYDVDLSYSSKANNRIKKKILHILYQKQSKERQYGSAGWIRESLLCKGSFYYWNSICGWNQRGGRPPGRCI